MSWFHTHCQFEDRVPLKHCHDISKVMKAAATNVGMQQWSKSYLMGAQAVLITVNSATTLDTFVFGQFQPTYGINNPFQERIIMSVEDTNKILTDIGAGGISWDCKHQFLVVLGLLSHNRITCVKVPKDWQIMFGTTAFRDSFLSTFADAENPDEVRTVH